MSIKAMNWAWEQNLAPSTKLVLLALADIADDSGYCWPSITTLSKKVGVSYRTVQRILDVLKKSTEKQRAFVRVMNRRDKKGSQRSNAYYLQMQTDKLSVCDFDVALVDRSVAPERTNLCQGEGDIDVAPRGDTAMTSLEPPPNPPIESKNRTTKSSFVDKPLSGDDQKEIARQISRLGSEEQHKLMIQLTGRLRDGAINSPTAWTKAAVDRMLKYQEIKR